MPRSTTRSAGIVVVLVVLLAAAAWAIRAVLVPGASAQVVARQVAPRGALLSSEQTTIDLFEKTRPSVVFITTQAQVMDRLTRNIFNIPRGTGSGFAWDDQGHIVTNNHVVAGASGAQVRLADGRDVPAQLVGLSPAHDLAVLKVDISNAPAGLPIGTSADLKVGQAALAIGNPFGLDWTLTTGIVSAVDRSLPSQDGATLIQHLIQTDAAINPGNSGGPLLDSAGRLIGVNTAIFSPSGASAGVGFAVPVDTVNRVVPQLIARGRYVRPVLGVEVDRQVNDLLTRRLNVEGVVVLTVTPGTGAAAAGLRGIQTRGDGSIVPGDIITEVNGDGIDGVPELLARLDEFQVGQAVRLTLLRDGKSVEVPVTLQAGTN